jgi:heptosyltransferase-1
MSELLALDGRARVLVVRLGAMGDILHALPAVESLKRNFPALGIDWVVKPRWMALLEGNPALRRLVPFDREQGSVWKTARRLREADYDLAIDLQGLVQSALIARFSGARRTVGFAKEACRERLASWFYAIRVSPAGAHVAEKHLDVMRTLGAVDLSLDCSLPPGEAEGTLPDGPFVLASPFAGWRSKQWPLANYASLARLLAKELGVRLVLNVAEADLERVSDLPHVHPHASSIRGLIHATRVAAAVVGVDSGPLHLAAALKKSGVALFGPTDPARNGPVTGQFTVMRDPRAATTYKREDIESDSMKSISPQAVFEALAPLLTESLAQHEAKPPRKDPIG